MKSVFKQIGVIALVSIIGFSFAALSLTGGGGGGGSGDPDLPGNIYIHPDTNVTTGTELTATYSGEETVSYQWKKDGNNVGTNSDKFTPAVAGSYTVTVSAANYKSKTSAAVKVTAPGSGGGGDKMTWTLAEKNPFEKNEIIYAIAYGNNKFVAVGGKDNGTNAKIAYSSDGSNWTSVTDSTFGTDNAIFAIAYGNDKFVAVSGKSSNIPGKIAYSSDGSN